MEYNNKDDDDYKREKKDCDDNDVMKLPPIETWPHRPLLLQADTIQCPNLRIHHTSTENNCTMVPIGTEFSFESNLFQGKGLLRIRSSSNTTSEENSSGCYFENKKRKYEFIIQGTFKEEMLVSDVLSGRYYQQPLSMTPPILIDRMIQKVLSRVAPGVEMDLSSNQPKVIAPFSDCIQILNDNHSNNEEENNLEKDTSCWMEQNSSFFNGIHVSSKQRKKLFSKPNNNNKKKKNKNKKQQSLEEEKPFVFDTRTVYTFVQYDDLFDYSTYQFDLKYYKFDMSKIVNGQPFQFNAIQKSTGSYLWLFQIWHENLLPPSKPNQNQTNQTNNPTTL